MGRAAICTISIEGGWFEQDIQTVCLCHVNSGRSQPPARLQKWSILVGRHTCRTGRFPSTRRRIGNNEELFPVYGVCPSIDCRRSRSLVWHTPGKYYKDLLRSTQHVLPFKYALHPKTVALLRQSSSGEELKGLLDTIGLQAHRDAIDRVCSFWAGREESKTRKETQVAADAKAMEKFSELAACGRRFGLALKESSADSETIRWALEATTVSGVTVSADTAEEDLALAMDKSRGQLRRVLKFASRVPKATRHESLNGVSSRDAGAEAIQFLNRPGAPQTTDFASLLDAPNLPLQKVKKEATQEETFNTRRANSHQM